MPNSNRRPQKFYSPEISNAVKTLWANIRFADVDGNVKAIVITSSSVNEGKTTVVTNLAYSMAEAGKKVLVVDTDMRRSCISTLLGIAPPCGMCEVLAGNVPLKRAVVKTDIENLYLLSCEDNIPNPPDILSSQRFEKLVGFLKEKFDYVLFDTPPLGTFVDAAIIGHVCDGAIIAVRQNKTRRGELSEAVMQLESAGVRILGSVMTFAEKSSNDYYYTYYYKSGDRVRAALAEAVTAEQEGKLDLDFNSADEK